MCSSDLIEKIYVDAIYEVIPYDEVSYTELYKVLDFISSEFQVDFFFGLDKKEEELPEILRQHVENIASVNCKQRGPKAPFLDGNEYGTTGSIAQFYGKT